MGPIFFSFQSWTALKRALLCTLVGAFLGAIFLVRMSPEKEQTDSRATCLKTSTGLIFSGFNRKVHSRLELPLPDYIPYYKKKELPLGSSELSVCTNNDAVLENSEPQPTIGCRDGTHHNYPGITLPCRTPIHINCGMTRSQAREVFFRNLHRTTAVCNGLKAIGDPKVDGVWRICLTNPFSLKKNSCLVYSFGISNEWSFDDSISKDYGCEVHSFDPTMGMKDHKRDERITFHNLGVAGHGERFKEAQQKGWKMMTFKEIFQMLGHTDKTIDILKVDIEYTEWDAFEDAVKSNALRNVKQIAAEFHVWSDQIQAYVRFHRILVALENAGFEKWFLGYKSTAFQAVNQETGKLTQYDFQVDTGFINTKFLS